MTATALVSVTWGVLALGAVYPWAYWPLLWGALITAFLGLHRGPGLLQTLTHPLLLAVAGLCVAVILQVIPLSPSVVRIVSPSTYEFVQTYVGLPHEVVAAATDGTMTARDAKTPQTLSLQPRATGRALTFVLAFGLFVAGGATGFRANDARHLAVGLLVVGAVVAFIAIVQRATSSYPSYWIWEPREAGTSWGPFVNRNHFAGWMVMAISVGLGYFMALSSRAMRHVEGWRNRVLWLASQEANLIVLTGVALVLMGLALALTASRSGTVCFVASMLLVGWAAMRNGTTTRIPKQRRIVMAASVACLALATVVLTGLPVMSSRFSYSEAATPFSLGARVSHWTDALEVARRFPLTGTGLNTFTFVTPFFKSDAVPNSDEAHNDYLQLAAEGGLLVGIPAAVFAVLFIGQVRRRFRAPNRSLTSYWVRVGAVAGLVAIAIQETVEFSLQLPGNAIMFAALCMLAVHAPEGDENA